MKDIFKKAVKTTFDGYFSYKKYVKYAHHDHKFGANKFDYLCQVPILNVAVVALFWVLVIVIGYGIIRPIQFIMEYRHEKQKKSNS